MKFPSDVVICGARSSEAGAAGMGEAVVATVGQRGRGWRGKAVEARWLRGRGRLLLGAAGAAREWTPPRSAPLSPPNYLSHLFSPTMQCWRGGEKSSHQTSPKPQFDAPRLLPSSILGRTCSHGGGSSHRGAALNRSGTAVGEEGNPWVAGARGGVVLNTAFSERGGPRSAAGAPFTDAPAPP